ncbi:alpha-N-acetylglucosaminidase [Nonomuraea sediminis]|uniref:alpha-N-acetylglucosaminidase n=1 Tax=Nonomuraea sediminis TaxID=2835864 RepID=UPI001BDC90A5|nr:alpha-N-acetylglucosaminidase TIM-barrel domain-containing protein [Nonomuraea sediminis]
MTELTRRRMLTGMAVLGGAMLAAPAQHARAATADQGFDTTAAADALRRLVPDHHQQITLRAVGGQDRFKVTGRTGQITLEGTSNAVLLTAFNAYLHKVALADISWNGEQVNLPKQLPAPAKEITGAANVPHRFALNDTNDGYTSPYRSWEAWERELDVLALHGINNVLVYIGGDAVYYDTFREFGYSDEELRAWIPAPAHQPWWLLQNMSHFGGPVSRQLIEQRAALAKKIISRVRELGMTPVLPGYFGTVPDDFVRRNPGASVVPQGSWGSFARPDWLDPRTDAFTDVAAAFYSKQRDRFGDSTMYKMDLLHEGGNPGDVPVSEAARAVETALAAARPGAIWVMLGWQTNPRKEILDGVHKSRMLIVDGLSDRYPTVTDRESDWGGTPYTFGSIWNFGGHTAMGANAPDWVSLYPQWRGKKGSALAGIAAMPEGADNNAPALALLTELAWTSDTIDLDEWFASYATSRYGGADPHATAAWRTIRATAYGTSRADGWSEAPDGLFGARPSLGADKAAAWSPAADRYDTTAFDAALTSLLQVAPKLRDSSAYRYDLLDVTRQVLSNRSRVLLPQIKAAYEVGDSALFTTLSRTWLGWMTLLDDVLATSDQHLLGRWLADARSWGSAAEEKDQLEYDARSLITTWGGRQASEEGLHDYANREWSGLVTGLYLTRWKTFFSALSAGRRPADIDWFEVEDRWEHQHDTYPTSVRGDIQQLAKQVRDTLAADPYQVALTASGDRGAVAQGRPVTVTVSFTNRNGFAAATNVTLSVTPPKGLVTKPEGVVTAASVASGETFRARFTVTLTGPADTVVAQIPVGASYQMGGTPGSAVAALRLLAGTGVTEPYRSASFNDAVFGQAEASLGIEGGGADLWGGTNEFGTIYRAGAYGVASVATVKVTLQDNTGGWARAGLITRNSLPEQGGGGYVNLAVTPSNGCVLAWDADGNGTFDSISLADSYTAPVYLRLTRSDATYTGECSPDGITWTTVGKATPGGPAANQDVGVFMTAANGWTGTRGVAEFQDFTVS